MKCLHCTMENVMIICSSEFTQHNNTNLSLKLSFLHILACLNGYFVDE